MRLCISIVLHQQREHAPAILQAADLVETCSTCVAADSIKSDNSGRCFSSSLPSQTRTPLIPFPFAMANSDTVHRINAHQRTPVVLMRHLSGHHCLIAHYVWAGTDIHNLNPECKAWFVGVGREVGVHLDE
jgi:hypothetical protein